MFFKQISLSLLSIISLQGFCQLIPNGSFEDFDFHDSVPDYWNYINIGGIPDSELCSETGKFKVNSDASKGKRAILLETFETDRCVIESNIETFNENYHDTMPSLRFLPINGFPKYLSLDYKYRPKGDDTAAILLEFVNYDRISKRFLRRDSIIFQFISPQNNYQKKIFEIPEPNWQGEKPNYFKIQITSCGSMLLNNPRHFTYERTGTPGTKLWIDDISFQNPKAPINDGDYWKMYYEGSSKIEQTFIYASETKDREFLFYLFDEFGDTNKLGLARVSINNDSVWFTEHKSQQEKLVYNLNANIGDSVWNVNPAAYVHVDTIYEQNGRRIIEYKEYGSLFNWREKLKDIEGFGPNRFFFYPFSNFYTSFSGIAVCKYNKAGETLYSINSTKFKNCQLGNFSSISHQQETSHQISINNGVLTVIPSCDEISIYNYLGQEIRNGKSTTLQVNDLRPGTYILRIRSKESITNRTIFID